MASGKQRAACLSLDNEFGRQEQHLRRETEFRENVGRISSRVMPVAVPMGPAFASASADATHITAITVINALRVPLTIQPAFGTGILAKK